MGCEGNPAPIAALNGAGEAWQAVSATISLNKSIGVKQHSHQAASNKKVICS